MKPALVRLETPLAEQPGGPERLLRHAATEVRTYQDHRRKRPFADHFEPAHEFRWATPDERVHVVRELAATRARHGRMLVVSDGDAGLAALADAVCGDHGALVSLSGRGERAGDHGARALGATVTACGARDGGPTGDGDPGSALEAAVAAARVVVLSVHLDALDPLFAPGTGLALGGGWSSRELLAAVRSALRLGVQVVELSGYDPHRDRHDLALVAAAAVLTAVVEAWR